MILLTGSTGVLGTELRKHTKFQAPTRKMGWDITKNWNDIYFIKNTLKGIKLIVHCAAFTDLVRAESEKDLCYQTNVIGTRNLASLGIPMLYISTEYVFDGEKGNYDEEAYPAPQNFYSLTKLLGEYESRRTRSVVVRCLFKPRPFKHDVVCSDSSTSGDYVDVIAQDIALAIKKFNDLPPTIHIGTGRKSLEALARQTKPDIKSCTVRDISSVRLPKDTSLDCSKWERIKNEV